MRGLYLLLTCLSLTIFHLPLKAATITWTGSSGGRWSNAANWSPATVPAVSDNVVINTSTTILIDIGSVNINSLTVTANSNVVLSASLATNFSLTGANIAMTALQIDNGSTLKSFANGTEDLHIFLLSGAVGIINGTFILEGAQDPVNYGSTITLNPGSLLTVNGTISENPHSGKIESTVSTLVFGAGSYYIHNRDGGIIPKATYNATSTVLLSGIVGVMPTFPASQITVGNLTVNAAQLDVSNQPFYLSLPTQAVIAGDFKIENTNGASLVIISSVGGAPNVDNIVTIQKNFELSANSNIEFSFADFDNESRNYTMQVNGNFVQTAGVFSLQANDFVTGTSKLAIKGNFLQSGGSFTANSMATDAAKNLFVVEMNGNTAQTVSAGSGTIDNANNMVALRINNSSGGVSLLSPLSIGRIDLLSGILTTSVSNLLTINSPGNSAIIVANASASGYIAGPIARNTNTTGAYLFPVGKSGVYRPIEIIPNTATLSKYIVDYFRLLNSSPVTFPLTNISNEYWAVTKVSGSDAVVQLTLNGAVPGAVAASELVVAGFDGSKWSSVKGSAGTSIIPGNVTSGVARSDVQSVFNLFTFGVIGGTPLPIILLDFTAKKSTDAARLQWEVDPADIPTLFEIMRSADGINFIKVGNVAGVNGVTKYNFTEPLINGNVYYRLRMTDSDGTIVFSKIVVIGGDNGNRKTIASLAPTLVTSSAKLTINASFGGQMDVYITDMSGRIWRKWGLVLSAGENEQQLDLSGLSSGVYQMVGYMNGEKTSVIRFVKQ